MSDLTNNQNANAGPESMDIEFAGAVPARKGKRRNCMIVPGSSNPLVAKLFADNLMKEVLGEKH
jgi:hypothetical protein